MSIITPVSRTKGVISCLNDLKLNLFSHLTAGVLSPQPTGLPMGLKIWWWRRGDGMHLPSAAAKTVDL